VRLGRARGASLALLAAVFVVDQATKLWVLHLADFSAGPIAFGPFVDITLVWNRGISYGLLQAEGTGRWLLVAFTAAGAAALAIWLARARHTMVCLALGAIIGGALGNLVDRIAYGAVVDFVQIHGAGYSWYVFNVADAAIVVGVGILLLDGLTARGDRG